MLRKWVERGAARIAERQTALLSAQQRAIRRMLCFPSVLRSALDTRVGITPHDVVFRSGTRSLLRYRRQTPASYSPPVLFCYALINRPYILDLQPGKSVVQRYLDQGFDVYLIDWGVPTQADCGLTLEDYVSRFLDEVVGIILREHSIDALHLLGYCMGGTLAALYTAVNPERVETLTLLAAPIDFGSRESLLSVWTNRRYFDVDAFIDANGNCPAWFLQLCFLYTKPIQNLVQKNLTFYDQMEDERFLGSYFAMERWVNDNIPIAGETFREFVKKLYQNDELVQGQFHLGSRRVELDKITCPLLLLTAENDHLVPPRATNGIQPHVRSRDIKAMMIDAGHVGLAVSGKAHKTFWPESTRWLAERSCRALPAS
jgi:polyhydroxyalkanoate synthase